MAKKKQFKWSILGKKLLKNVVALLIAGAAMVYADNPYYLAISPVLLAADNYFKHK